jgi:hypothetical protein
MSNFGGLCLDLVYSIQKESIGEFQDWKKMYSPAYALGFDVVMSQIQAMAEDAQPLLSEFRDSGLLKEVECLTRSLTQASDDLRKVNSSIMTPENTELIQKSIYTLVYTLKNVESISSDILGFTGDEATRKNLKLLIKSLSRLL